MRKVSLNDLKPPPFARSLQYNCFEHHHYAKFKECSRPLLVPFDVWQTYLHYDTQIPIFVKAMI